MLQETGTRISTVIWGVSIEIWQCVGALLLLHAFVRTMKSASSKLWSCFPSCDYLCKTLLTHSYALTSSTDCMIQSLFSERKLVI